MVVFRPCCGVVADMGCAAFSARSSSTCIGFCAACSAPPPAARCKWTSLAWIAAEGFSINTVGAEGAENRGFLFRT